MCTCWTALSCHAASASPDARCGEFVGKGMKLLASADLSPSDREAFDKRAPGAQPGCVVTDFNADGIKDAAMIGQDRKTGTVFLVIAVGKQDGGFTTAIRKSLGESIQGVFLLPHSGKVVEPNEAVDTPETAHKLTGGAIDVVFVEKATVVYFWDQAAGQIAESQTGD
jgi:hypothetical protein